MAGFQETSLQHLQQNKGGHVAYQPANMGEHLLKLGDEAAKKSAADAAAKAAASKQRDADNSKMLDNLKLMDGGERDVQVLNDYGQQLLQYTSNKIATDSSYNASNDMQLRQWMMKYEGMAKASKADQERFDKAKVLINEMDDGVHNVALMSDDAIKHHGQGLGNTNWGYQNKKFTENGKYYVLDKGAEQFMSKVPYDQDTMVIDTWGADGKTKETKTIKARSYKYNPKTGKSESYIHDDLVKAMRADKQWSNGVAYSATQDVFADKQFREYLTTEIIDEGNPEIDQFLMTYLKTDEAGNIIGLDEDMTGTEEQAKPLIEFYLQKKYGVRGNYDEFINDKTRTELQRYNGTEKVSKTEKDFSETGRKQKENEFYDSSAEFMANSFENLDGKYVSALREFFPIMSPMSTESDLELGVNLTPQGDVTGRKIKFKILKYDEYGKAQAEDGSWDLSTDEGEAEAIGLLAMKMAIKKGGNIAANFNGIVDAYYRKREKARPTMMKGTEFFWSLSGQTGGWKGHDAFSANTIDTNVKGGTAHSPIFKNAAAKNTAGDYEAWKTTETQEPKK